MKLIDAIFNVDKSEQNSTSAEYDDFCSELGINCYDGWNEEFDKKVKGYYIIKRHCTDSWVGLVVYYFNDKPIAISTQTGRKSNKEYQFLSDETVEEIKTFIKSIMAENEGSNYILVNLDEEIEDRYSVDFSGQLLTREGFYKETPCKVTNMFREDYISHKVEIEFEDGNKKIINVRDFQIPLHIKL